MPVNDAIVWFTAVGSWRSIVLDYLEGDVDADTFVVTLVDTKVDYQPEEDYLQLGLPFDLPNPWLVEFVAGITSDPNAGIRIEV